MTQGGTGPFPLSGAERELEVIARVLSELDRPEYGSLCAHNARRATAERAHLELAMHRGDLAAAVRHALSLGLHAGVVLNWPAVYALERDAARGRKSREAASRGGRARAGKTKARPVDIDQQYLAIMATNRALTHGRICAMLAQRAGLSRRTVERVMRHSPIRRKNRDR